MGTLGGFPNPPTLWLRQAKPAVAYAIMGTLGGFAPPFGPPPATFSPLALLGLAMPFGPAPATPTPLASLGLARWCAAGDEGAREARGAGRAAGGPEVPAGGAGGLPTRLARSRTKEGRSQQDLRSSVQNHDTCVRDWPGPSFLLQVGQDPAWARNLPILRRLLRPACAFLTDRRRCCKP